MTRPPTQAPLELWGGVECTVNRVGDRWFDEVARTGHDRRDADLLKFAAIGIKAIRYPVLWERLAPGNGDELDWRWTDQRLATLSDLGIRPIVGLVHHGSGPACTSLLDDRFPARLAAFAGAVARRYPWVKDFTPVNEPLTTARFSGLYGHWYPHHRSDRSYVRALLNQLRATVLSMRAIRAAVPDARLIQTEDCGSTFSTPALQAQADHESTRQWLTWDLLTGRVDARHPLHDFLTSAGMTTSDEAFFLEADCRPDVLGLNYYLTSDRYLDEHLERYPPEAHASNGTKRYADVEAVRARPDGIAGHLRHLADAWHRYRIPVALTEVHLACTREEQLRWLWEAWRAAETAREQGIDVRAVTAWALLGSYDWDSLVTVDAGHYESGVFDLRAPEPRPTALAILARQLAAGETPTHPTLAVPGWWHRPDRLLFGARSAFPHPDDARPILVLGGPGQLGHAFQRICAWRGVPVRALGRHECEASDPLMVDAALRRFNPWLVVHVAEWPGGLLTIAAACRKRGIKLVTFSSLLVFDGRKATPYVENDATCPVTPVGQMIAAADCRMLADFPEVLILRTGALFGPWDETNFALEFLDCLDRAQPVPVGSVTIAPTYVPDLVHAALDLAIDDERGLWHIVNSDPMSWNEFARRLADATGRGADSIGCADETSAAAADGVVLGSQRATLLPPLGLAIEAFAHARASQPDLGRTSCV